MAKNKKKEVVELEIENSNEVLENSEANEPKDILEEPIEEVKTEVVEETTVLEVETEVVEEEVKVEEIKPKKNQSKTKKVKQETAKEVEAQVIEEMLKVEASDQVLEEIEIESDSQRKKRLKEESKEEERQEKLKAKAIKIHQRRIKKHPVKLVRYETDLVSGLSTEAVEKRKIDNIVNKTENRNSKTIGNIIVSNSVTFFNILMIAIGIVLIYVKAFTDLTFLVIVTLNTVIGIFQEIRAKKTIDRLSLISAPTAVVVRNGVAEEISVQDVVLDDLLLLDSGKQICADSIVIEGSIEVNESLLTGESDAIVKKPGDTLYSGSYVISGKCKARVDKVGKDNYIEKLTSQAKKYKKPNSDLLLSLRLIIFIMSFVVVIVGGYLFYTMYFKYGQDLTFSIRKTAGAMIGMIPSGLLLTTSIALAIGVIKLTQRNVLVQELYCIEMLARVNCICLDKTGTITDGTMSVKNVIDYNTIHGLTTKNVISGMLNALDDNNLTSVALKEKFGNGKRIKYSAAIPFSSQRKYQAVTFDKYGTFILGAPEFVLREKFELIKNDVNKYAAMGYRVLCLAHRNGTIVDNNLPDSELEIASIILIEDNIRPDAINTIKYFRESGVSVRVISGDNPLTVSKISQRAGIERAEDYISLDGLTDQEVIKCATKYTVFGRVSPAQKKLLITTLKESGLTVAMTGDGVNDILALKEADCSIAVASGSEAARNVSHLVLLDSNFDSMPKVVSEGRRVINNVTAVSSLFLTKTIFSLLLAIQALTTGVYPISTNQLILIDFLAIGLPSVLLVIEPNNRTVTGKFLLNVLKRALPGALVILVISLVTFGLSDSLQLDSTTLSTIIVIAATHTCLMVLFHTCKPFSTLRKVLCTFSYAAFIFAICVVPQFLEFRPLAPIFEYYSDTIKTEMITKYPTIEVSKDSYYIVDGIVTQYYRNPSNKTNTITCVEEKGNFYYRVNDTTVYVDVKIPDITFDQSGNIFFIGYPIDNVTFEDKVEFICDENGILYRKGNSGTLSDAHPIYTTLTSKDSYYNFEPLYGDTSTLQVKYCIIPTIEIKDGELIIDGKTSTEYKYKTSFTSLEGREIKINPETMELLIDGKKVYKTYNETGLLGKEPYKVQIPNVSYDVDGKMYLDAVSSGYSLENLFGDMYINGELVDELADIYTGTCVDALGNVINIESVSVIPGDVSYFLSIDGVTKKIKSDVMLSHKDICPDVETTVSGKYIINGYYTDFEASASESLSPRMNSEHYLVLGNQVTDYKISSSDILTQTGGMVETLSTSAFIFLLMLCLTAAPLMSIFRGIIPWIRSQLKTILKQLSRT